MFHHGLDEAREVRYDGRKRFADMGAGNNRDSNAIEALRFFQTEERLGKNSGQRVEVKPTRQVRDSHRYYLEAEGKSDYIPGRARISQATLGSFAHENEAYCDQAQLLSAHSEVLCDCDSLPLGAEWSTCKDQELPMF